MKAQKYQLSVLLVLINCLVFLGCQGRSGVITIKKIDVYAIDNHIKTNTRLDALGLINWQADLRVSVVDDVESLQLIKQRISELTPMPPEWNRVGNRAVGIFRYSNGESDTLQIGGTRIFKWQDTVYDEDTVLLEALKIWWFNPANPS